MTQEAELAEREHLCKQEPPLILRTIMGKRQPTVEVKGRSLGVKQTLDCFPINWSKLLNSFVFSSLKDIGHTHRFSGRTHILGEDCTDGD